MKLYLAHPTTQRKSIRLWELGFEARTRINLLNPFYDKEEGDPEYKMIELMDKGEIAPNYPMTVDEGTEIFENDLFELYECDGVVAFIGYSNPGMEQECASVGTPIEIYHNSLVLNKPTYIITNTLQTHPFLLHMATKIFSSHEEFEEYIVNEQKKSS